MNEFTREVITTAFYCPDKGLRNSFLDLSCSCQSSAVQYTNYIMPVNKFLCNNQIENWHQMSIDYRIGNIGDFFYITYNIG